MPGLNTVFTMTQPVASALMTPMFHGNGQQVSLNNI
jgi:hypothetical protein